MAITIIVEDGTGKDDANSYVSVTDLISFAEMRGTVLEDNDETASYLIKAMDYLSTKKFKGSKANPTQSLAWPRKDAYIDCDSPSDLFPSDVIPTEIKDAQKQLALVASTGVDLMPTTTAADMVVREVIGPIDTTYANPAEYGLSYGPLLTLVNSLLSCLVTSGGTKLRVVRGGYG